MPVDLEEECDQEGRRKGGKKTKSEMNKMPVDEKCMNYKTGELGETQKTSQMNHSYPAGF